MAGPVLAGLLADRIGFDPALRLALVVQAVSASCRSSSGACTNWCRMTPKDSARVERDHDGLRAGTGGNAHGLSFLFARNGHYTTLFAVGAIALILALAIDLGARLAGRKPI